MSKNTNLSFLTDYITADITNGRIGINNASPTVAFDVVGATKITGVLTLTSTISNGTYAYTLPSATGTLALTSAISGTTNYVAKFTSSTGIGNSSIQDNGSAVGVNTSNLLTWFSGGYMAMQFGGMAGLSSNTSNTSVTGSFDLSYNLYTDSAGNYQYMNTTSARAGSIMTLEGGNISFKNASSGTGSNPTVTERMRITSTGNVGIGIDVPTGNANRILHISGVDSAELHLTRSNSGTTSILGGYLNFDGSNNFNLQNRSSGTINFITGTSERMRIHANGNVVIGSSTDNGNKLNVVGNISSNSTVSGSVGSFSTMNANAFKSFVGSTTIAAGATATIYTMDTMGLYTVQASYVGSSIIFCASAIFYAQIYSGNYVKCIDLYDGANIALFNSGSSIQVRNDGFGTYGFSWTILFQPAF